MADEKTLNTRILLKYDSLANWTSKNTVLKKGEVAFVAVESVPPVNGATGSTALNSTILYKVGDGETPFNSLNYGNALAADVYGWAKEQSITITKNGTGNVVASITWDATLNGGKGGLKYETASVATAEGMEDLQEALNALTEQVNAMYTNTQIDELINTAKTGAETTAANALATARTEISAEIDADVKALADGAVKVNTDAIDAIKDDANIDSFADVVAELAKKQNTIPANTYDAYGSASTAEQNAKDYADQIKSDLLGTEELEGTYDTLKEIGAWIATSGVDATELADAIAVETQAREAGDKAINDTLATYGDIVTHDAAEFQEAGNYETAGAAAQALADAKADTTAQIEALKLSETYEPIGAETRAKAYTDELANGTVKTNSDKIAALEALDYILNGDTVILDCGGAE